MTALNPLRSRLSLRARILFLVTGSVVAATILSLGAIFVVTRREEREVIEKSVRTASNLADFYLREHAATLTASVKTMAAQPTIVAQVLGNSEASEDWATVSEVARDAAEHIDAREIVLTSATGRTLGRFARGSPTSAIADSFRPDYHGEFGFSEALREPGDGWWSGIALHQGRLYVTARAVIRDPVSRYPRGVLSAYSNIDDALAIRLSQLVDCDMAFVQGSRIFGTSRSLAGAPEFLENQLSRVTFADGSRFFAVVRRLPLPGRGEQVGALILYPYDRAVDLPRQLETALLIPFILSLLVALLAGIAVARSLTLPLEGVVRAARTLQQGGWPDRFGTERGDEIGLLQSVFDEMNGSLREARDRLLSLIDTDPLTELDNHRRFQERLGQEMERAAASGESLSLLLLDIDRFHAFNQRAGHAAGDDALRGAADCLRLVLPPLAVSARFGGEEFAVLLPRHAGNAAADVAELVREAFKEFTKGSLTFSVGYATRRQDDAESFMLAAELALSQAKQMGRDCVCNFDDITAMSGADGTDPAHLYRFLKDGSLSTIQALAAAVDAKDSYTRGHSLRVAETAALLARRLGLPPADVDLAYTTGTLHDVGKIGVPDRILLKATSLDDEERRMIEAHPVLGELIVGKAPQLSETLPGVRSHHERWDGRGYPDGLSQTEIPLVARILAIADTFDAMTSDRPYRLGLSEEMALDEINRNAGAQFDPELARVFVAAMRDRVCAAVK